MGGSGGGSAGPKPEVQYAEPLDYKALMLAASEAAKGMTRDQIAAQIEAYPPMEKLQLGTIRKIANNLRRSPWTAASRQELSGARQLTSDVAGIGQLLREQAGPTAIENTLRQQAESELALGRSLSAGEMRDAQQSARTAMEARGMATSMPSTAAEILNRDRFANARQAERRNFASATNQMVTGNVTGRYGQAASVLGNAAGMRQANAGLSMNLDPYQRALGFAGIGSTIGTNLTNAIGNTFNNAAGMAGNVASFNANMIDSRANSAMNNWASLRAAGMQAGAMNNAATLGMIGSIGGGLLGGGLAALSDKREKTEIKPLGKSGSVLGLKMFSYKYKGDDKERIVMMAQDVQKVLPEAVEEVNYKCKKRLAIKGLIKEKLCLLTIQQ